MVVVVDVAWFPWLWQWLLWVAVAVEVVGGWDCYLLYYFIVLFILF